MNQIIEKHVSTWADGKTLPASYVVPSGKRAGDNVVPTVPNIPVIDLSNSQSSDRKEIVQQIIEAAQHFGFFQVINHGVSRRLMDDAIDVFKEFLELPSEEKSRICLEEQSRKFSLFTSRTDYDKETHHFWRDATTHSCTPLEECIQYWPSKPLRYRKLSNFSDDQSVVEHLSTEIKLLRNLRNNNIITLFHVWRDKKHNTLNFITEVCTSGNLREYRKKHRHVSIKALKKWSKQILKGLDYLHTHELCIIHRDLNCSNIFINGNVGN